jgi:hypothetical protein
VPTISLSRFSDMDILRIIIEKNLSEDEADSIFESELDQVKEDFHLMDLFQLTREEATAVIHGMPLIAVANWRENGWPDKCYICGKHIEVSAFGWWHKEVGGIYHLVHIDCVDGHLE